MSEDDDPYAETRQAWTALCEVHGVSLAAAAIAFAGLPAIVEKVVIGFSRPEEVEPTLAAARESETVPPALWRRAKEVGLLHPDL